MMPFVVVMPNIIFAQSPHFPKSNSEKNTKERFFSFSVQCVGVGGIQNFSGGGGIFFSSFFNYLWQKSSTPFKMHNFFPKK
jgi:hypothetical protein